jgi:FKBP-type peptidyl-prolyl cis-trans isomerase 2
MAKRVKTRKQVEKFESLKDKTGHMKKEKIDKAIELEGKKRIEIIKESGKKKGIPLAYAVLIVIVIAAIGAVLILMTPSTTGKNAVKAGDVVQIAYALKLANGNTLEQGNFTFKVGAGEAIAGVDEAVVGMKTGERKTVTIPPEKAYGYPDPFNIIDVPLYQVLNMTESLTVEQFNQSFGFEPELNKAYQFEGMNWPMRVITIANGTVTLKHEPYNGSQYELKDSFGSIYGTAKVTVLGDQIRIDSMPINGSEVYTVIGLGRIIGFNETHMKMDFNHKLAGQTLTFDLTVLNFVPY